MTRQDRHADVEWPDVVTEVGLDQHVEIADVCCRELPFVFFTRASGMVATRVNDARRTQANYLSTEAGPMSRPILERLGFKDVSTITNYVFEVELDAQ